MPLPAPLEKSVGTTLAAPAAANFKPDLQRSLHDIREYFEDHNAYGLVDTLLKELISHQPEDPVGYMVDFLKNECPASGPLRVIVSGPPGLEIGQTAKQVANTLGLVYISSSELLKAKGIDTSNIDLADDAMISELVVARVKEANKKMWGFMLDGFPRTRCQTSYLVEHRIVPNRILVLTASEGYIRERQRRIADGEEEGTLLSEEALAKKLAAHACHAADALQVYQDSATVINLDKCADSAAIQNEMISAIEAKPRMKGPRVPPRIVILGPHGSGADELGRMVAARLGAVFVDGPKLKAWAKAKEAGTAAESLFGLPNALTLAAQDSLGIIGARLRQPDCSSSGWVLSGFPSETEADAAAKLAADAYLAPTCVLYLSVSKETCLANLANIREDPVTGEIYNSPPPAEDPIALRLRRRPVDDPAAVSNACTYYEAQITYVVQRLASCGFCHKIPADAPLDDVFARILALVEAPRS